MFIVIKISLLAALLLVAITDHSCGANRLSHEDVDILLKIVEDTNPNLVKIVYDKTSASSRILNRIVDRINENKNRTNPIPINVDTIGTKNGMSSLTDLLQNYTIFTVIIASDNSNDKIEAIASDIDKGLHRKHLNKYLVVFETIPKGANDSSWTRKVFELFWERRVLDVVLFYRSVDSIKVKTFNPFQQSRIIDFNANASANEIYATKLLDLNDYPMNILSFDLIFIMVRKINGTGFNGVDGNLINFLGRKLNASLIYRDLIINQNFTKTMTNELTDGVAQMVVPVIAYTSRETRFRAEISNSFQRMDFCIIAMKPTKENEVSNWLNSGIFVSYSRYLLLGTLTVFAILYKVFWSIHDMFQRQTDLVYESKESSFTSVVFMMYRAFFGDSLTYLPQSTSLRILLIGWILFSFLVTSAITANLLSTLVQPAELEELTSVDDLVSNNMKLLLPSELARKFKDNSPELFDRLNSTIGCIPWKNFLNETDRRNPRIAYSVVNYVVEHILHKNVDKITKKPVYYKLKECIFNMFGVYHMEPGSAYLQRINELLGLIHQVGLYQHWWQNAVFNMTVSSGFDQEEEDEDDDDEDELPVVLKLENIRGIFLLWLVGITLASIVFLVERGSKCKDSKHFQWGNGCCKSRM